MDMDKLAMVSAEKLFANKADGNNNFIFCQKSALMVGKAAGFSDYFLFHLSPEDDRFFRLLKEMLDAGCSPEFIEQAREARRQGAMYVLYFL